MTKLLPISFLVAFFSFFGISWIIFDTDPDNSKFYIYALLVFIISVFIWNIVGLFVYFVRARLDRRADSTKNIFTSYKISAFLALFVGTLATLAILKLVSRLNITLAVLALGCFVVYSYLGKKMRGRKKDD